MAGSSTAEPAQPRFYYDFASPDAYLAAERVNHVLGEVPEWVPVRLPAAVASVDRAAIEREAAAQGVQPVRWPPVLPPDTELALLVATYAKQIGRAVAFSLAAFRQAFAGGRDLSERDTVLIAAAACEMHPMAVVKGAGLRGTVQRLDDATERARGEGVATVPAVVLADGRVSVIPRGAPGAAA